jgi:D-amino-acid dehydrogenase
VADDVWDAVVVGGGLAGACVAYHLVTGGARTALLDRRDAGRATDAGAGILSPETTRVAGRAWSGLALDCGRYYPELAATLAADGEPGDDVGFGPSGLLAVALADWDIDAYEQLLVVAQARNADGGIVEIGPDEARRRFPALGTLTRALWNPGAARVDGRRFCAAVLRSARRHGLECVDASADRLVVGERGVEAVEAGDRRLRCATVVVAGGAWSPPLAAQLGVDIPVGPERGQIAHLSVPGADTGSWPIVSPVLGHYLVPFPGGRVATGATREPDAGFAVAPTVAGVRQVMNEVARVAPGLVDAELLEMRVGLRPASGDGLPVLGRLPGVGNGFVATGYGADGLLLSPWCGRLVASWVLGAAPDPALAPVMATRFVGA